ncbi:unnamed protein product [Symbiodinium natans]|uniref:SH3 domain-containing protein n=1 Tax=Symbiodinium natans TaxID=878477 RepID=A0A812HCM8_9DINO|nr:unnamed protein product [Symbiodinium natans]
MVDPDQYWSETQCEQGLIRTVVVKKHDATDGDQLTLKVNDIVIVMEKDETGWWGGHKEGEETTGWFPGICVQPLEGYYEPRDSRRHSPGSDTGRPKNDDYAQSRTAESGISSPVRRSYVASPQRTSSASAQGSRDGYGDQQSQIQEHHNRLVEDRQALILQVEHLKQENRSLEDKLRRQSDCDRRRYSQLEESFVTLEAKSREHLAELKATRDHKNELSEANSSLQKLLQASASEKEKLQAEVRFRTEEVQSLSTKLEVEVGHKTELSEERNRLLRRVQELETPEPQRQAEIAQEVPPAGVVKQLRDAFEHAAVERASTPTPRRPAMSDRERSKEQVTWNKVSGVAAPQSLPAQAGTSRGAGGPRRCPEDDSEFSPFHRGKKDMRLAFPTEAACPKTSSTGISKTAVVGHVFGPHH